MNLKKIVRASKCLNCETPLNIESDNFCPTCGQVNNTKKETAIGLVKELVEEFLHLDSKVIKSLVPLLFKPGFLTVDYINGKRARYFHPVRMFLIVTVIMFIVAGFSNTKEDEISKNKKQAEASDTSKVNSDAVKLENDSIYSFNTETLEFEKEEKNSSGIDNANFYWAFGSVKIQRDTLQHYLDQGITDPSALMDTFKIEKTFFNTIFFSQAIKSQLAGKDKIIDYYKHKLPWLLFSLMPVFAFVLYLFYIRRKIFFVDHLIYAFHLHTATFVVIILQDLITWLSPLNSDVLSYYIPIYYFISLKKVYGQSIPKTIFKGIGIGVFYFILGLLVLLLVAGLLFLMI
ncbi:MAG: DUF3667 domain-containing protein [Bacteroidetes bacterium]|nr:DUF3667 domain-containing protein [Bacteroidota bacterium]